MQMLDGFNKGCIDFESGEASSRKSSISVEPVLQAFCNKVMLIEQLVVSFTARYSIEAPNA